MKRNIIILLAILILSSCTSIRTYEIPPNDEESIKYRYLLDHIIIPVVNLEDVSASKATNYIVSFGVPYQGLGASIVMRDVPPDNIKITIHGKSMTFAEAVNEICRQTGTVWQFNGCKVLIYKEKKAEQNK